MIRENYIDALTPIRKYSYMSVIVAGFYRPGLLGVRQLLHCGYDESEINVITYERPRNEILLDYLEDKDISYTTKDIKEDSVIDELLRGDPEILYSLYFRDKIPSELLNPLEFGGVNLHPSLLPEYKGAFSVPWSIINGEDITGFTYHYMTDNFDSGRIIYQEPITILPSDTAYSLYHRLIHAGMAEFLTVHNLVVREEYAGVPQEDGGSYYERSLPHGGKIDPTWPDDYIKRFIKAMHFPPFDPAVLELEGKEFKIHSFEEYRCIRADHQGDGG